MVVRVGLSKPIQVGHRLLGLFCLLAFFLSLRIVLLPAHMILGYYVLFL